MKLLFDQNISFRIVKKLENVFPEARYGNTSTENIAEAIKKQHSIITEFLSSSDESAFLELK